MQIDEFLDLVRQRRSIRKFRPDPVPDEYIEKMLEAARWAMSGANAQPWEFIVVRDAETRGKIADLYASQVTPETWDFERTRVRELRHPMFADAPPKNSAAFRDAPVFIIMCGDPRAVQASVLVVHFLGYEGGWGSHYAKAMANATQILHLAAAALGLGSEWVSVGRKLEASLKALLDVPDDLTIPTFVPVGYPAAPATMPSRRELKELVHFEKYDRTRYRSGDDILEFLHKLRNRTTSSYAVTVSNPD